MEKTKHTTHVYNSFIVWFHSESLRNPAIKAVPTLTLFEWFLKSRRFKLSKEEANFFIEGSIILEVFLK